MGFATTYPCNNSTRSPEVTEVCSKKRVNIFPN